MNKSLRLSPFVLPQIRQGLFPLLPANLCDGTARIDYINRICAMANSQIAHGHLEKARNLQHHSCLSQHYLLWEENESTGKVSIVARPQFENELSFRMSELGVLFKDGRLREDSAMVYLPTGDDTPAFCSVLSRLHRGILRDDLLRLATELDVGLDESLLDELIARKVIDYGHAPDAVEMPGSFVSWLGHAFVRAVSEGRSVWFDPFPCPRMTWTAQEMATLLNQDVPDTFLLANYGPSAHHVTQDELPIPEAVFITHQDVDHYDLGALALLPPTVPIYVPEADPAMPWQIDLVRALKNVLGQGRNVLVLRHGETIVIGDIRVTALPFAGEFPQTLPHKWNCFYVAVPSQDWVLLADSAATQVQVELVKQLRQDRTVPLGIMTNRLRHRSQPKVAPGYRDGHEMFNTVRLYSWYVPAAETFSPALVCGLHADELKSFVEECGASMVYPYAHGNLPWYRLSGSNLHSSHIGSHTMKSFSEFRDIAKAAGASVVHLRHGEAFNPTQQVPASER